MAAAASLVVAVLAGRRGLVAPTREMIALLQLHDVVLSGAWCHSPTFAAFRAALDRFGVADADFTGYWEQPVAHTHPSVKISRYRHRNLKQGLLFISNLTPAIQEVALDLGAASLGFTPSRAEDIEHAYPLALQDGHVLVAVNGMDYRMIALYP